MTNGEFETVIAALHARDRELLIAGDSEAAFDLWKVGDDNRGLP